MYTTIEGTYEDGKITLKKTPALKKSKVMVTFLEEFNGLIIFTNVPEVFKNPVKVSELRKFNRKELHER